MVEDLGGPRGRTFARAKPGRGWMKAGLLAVAALGVAALALPVAAGSAQFVWNATASAPAGLYRIDHERWHVGDRVAVLPADMLAAELDRPDRCSERLEAKVSGWLKTCECRKEGRLHGFNLVVAG